MYVLFVSHLKHHIYILYLQDMYVFIWFYIYSDWLCFISSSFVVFEHERSQLVVKATDANWGKSSVLIGRRLSVVVTDSLMLCRDWW